MSPLLFPAIAVVALVAALAGKKKNKGAAAADMKTETEVGKVYRQAMSPEMTDLTWLRQAVAFLNSEGAPDLAANVSSRIASIQASAAAEAAAKAEAEAARKAWESTNGGAPTQAQLGAVWAKVQDGSIERDPNGRAISVYAWTLFQTYGTPQRAVVAKALMDRLAGAAAEPLPPSSIPAPVVVVKDQSTGTSVPVKPAEIEVPPASPVAKPTAPAVAPSSATPAQVQYEPPLTPPQLPPTVTTMPPMVVTPQPVAKAETAVDVDPKGTVALARQMIGVEESTGWKTALSSAIKDWQKRMGLTDDAKFGPKSALQMALEVGVLPLIRYWPKSQTLKAALTSYRDDLYTIAANLDQAGQPEHAAALRVSAEHETGQGYPAAPTAVPASTRIAQATKVAAAVGAVGSGDVSHIRTDLLYQPAAKTGSLSNYEEA